MRSVMMRWTVAGMVLMLSPVVGVAQQGGGRQLPADLSLVPPDGAGFLSVRVGELWKKADGLRKLTTTDPLLIQFLKEAEKRFGLLPRDIDRALVIFPDAQSKTASVVVLTLTRPYDKEKLLDTIVPGAEERTVADKTFHMHLNNTAVYLVNDRTFLVGSVRSVDDYFKQSTERNGVPVLNTALAAVDKHDMHFGLSLAGVQDSGPPFLKPYISVLGARGATLTVDFSQTTIRLEARIPFASPDAAREAEQLVRQGIDELQQFLPQTFARWAKGDGPPEFKKGMEKVSPFLQDVASGLKTALVTREGKEVRIDLTVSTKDPATDAVYTFCTFLAPITVARHGPPPTTPPSPSNSKNRGG